MVTGLMIQVSNSNFKSYIRIFFEKLSKLTTQKPLGKIFQILPLVLTILISHNLTDLYKILKLSTRFFSLSLLHVVNDFVLTFCHDIFHNLFVSKFSTRPISVSYQNFIMQTILIIFALQNFITLSIRLLPKLLSAGLIPSLVN